VKTKQKLSPHDQTVLTLLEKSARPMTAYTILDALNPAGFRSPPTVYRALESLMKKGLIHRIESLNAYTACHHEEAAGHISPFAICSACGTVEEIDNDALARAVKKMAGQFLAQLERKVFELTGICHACAKAAEKKARHA